MQTGGWIMMTLSVGTVVSLFTWCLLRVLFHRPRDTPEHLHGGLDIDTKDLDDQ